MAKHMQQTSSMNSKAEPRLIVESANHRAENCTHVLCSMLMYMCA